MPLKGDLKKLERMAKEIALKATVPGKIIEAARPKIEAVLFGTVGNTVTPYGEKWAALRGGGEPSGSIVHRVKVVQKGLALKARTDRVASYHQRGTARMVARPLIPDNAQGIPAEWQSILDQTSKQFMEAKS